MVGSRPSKLRHRRRTGGSPVSAFCSIFSQLLKLFPRTEFPALVKRTHAERVVDPNVTVDAYADRWLGLIASTVKMRTLDSYHRTLRLHIRPVFGAVRVRHLQKGRVKEFLASKLTVGAARNSVRIIHATLRAMLNAAVDDGLILANPADRLGRQLRLVQRPADRQEEIKA
jgi:Phage integrase, N-terminal SAM-like domain